MKKILHILPLGMLVLGLTAGWAQEKKPGELELSLEDCVARALKRNIGLSVQVLGPEISSEALNQAQDKFLPSLSLSVQTQDQNQASYSWLEAAESVSDQTNNVSFQASQAIPLGGSLTLSLTAYKTTSNRTAQTINPRYGSTLRLNFSQPLLRNFGYNLSRREIVIAANNLSISEQQLRKSLMDLVYNVESAYWGLVYSIENLNVKRSALDLARDLLEKNKRSVEIGTMAPMDILSAQAEVASREADIIQAEVQVKNAEDQLKQILNIAGEEEQGIAAIIPTDSPNISEKTVKLEEALAVAVQNRPDLEQTRIGLKNQELSLSYARNQVLPDLNLTASVWSPGVSGTRIVYIGNPLDGNIDYTIPGGISNSLKDTFNFKYKNYSVGLNFSLPLANVFSRANLAQAQLNMRQALLNLESQKEQVVLEIKNAVRAVEANYKRIAAYKVARELAEQKLAAEQEKLKVGQSTNFTVLSYQRDLANARVNELNAVITYNISLSNLDRALGLTLDNRNIKLVDYLNGR